MAYTSILITVRREHADRYFQNLSAHPDLRVRLVTNIPDALELLDSRDRHVDLLVLDNGLERAFELVRDLRQKHPRLLIILVDEDADFALPGQADEITTDPFTNDDLTRRIDRLMSDRRMETLRADTISPVRELAKKLRKASSESERQQAAVVACRGLGYDYAAFYRIESLDPLRVTLQAQDGSPVLQALAPKEATDDDIIGWVAKAGQSRIAVPGEELHYPPGQLRAVACTPVGMTSRYGVLIACRSQLITQQQVMLLELIGAQLAASVAKD